MTNTLFFPCSWQFYDIFTQFNINDSFGWRLLIHYSPKYIAITEFRESSIGRFITPMHLTKKAYAHIAEKEIMASQHKTGGNISAK